MFNLLLFEEIYSTNISVIIPKCVAALNDRTVLRNNK